MNKILVIVSHPDDEVLGAGGVIAKHVGEGNKVKIVILGTGVASRNPENVKDEIEKLRKDSRKALGVLGATDVEFLDFPDNQFDSVSLLEIVQKLEKIVSGFGPEIVYTHHWGDLNIDHRITFEAVMTACRPFSSPVKKILCFEVLSSSECNVQNTQNAFLPNYFVKLSNDEIEKKIAAMKEYSAELREAPHPRSIKLILALAELRGSQANFIAAEAFVLVREAKG